VKEFNASDPEKTHRYLTESSIDAVLVAGNHKVNSAVAFLRFLDRESNIVVKNFFNRSSGICNFSGAFKPLNYEMTAT
jgi:hypothetical protein